MSTGNFANQSSVMLEILPNSDSLNATGFKPIPGARGEDAKKEVMIFRIPHIVSYCVESYKSYQHDITYIVESHKDKASPGQLKLDRAIMAIGQQDTNSVKTCLNTIRHRVGERYNIGDQQFFDWRAVCYVLGFMASRTAANAEYAWASFQTMVEFIDVQTSVLNDSVFIHKGMYRNADEYATLLRIFALAGIRHARVVDDSVPSSGRPLRERDLGAYCLSLFAQILYTADSLSCGSHHVLAFFRGQTAAWTLRAHNDEGGWIRNVFQRASYPPTVGILSATETTQTYFGLQPRKPAKKHDILALSLNIFFSVVRCVSAADPGCENLGVKIPLIITRGSDTSTRPDSYPSLWNHTCDWWLTLNQKIDEIWNFKPCQIIDNMTFRQFFVDNLPERHLGAEWITPFFWVEPAGLNHFKGLKDKYFVPGSTVETVTTPLLPNIGVFKGQGYREHGPRVIADSILRVAVNQTSFRHWGISYVLNPNYNRDDGLAFIRTTQLLERGYVHRPMFCTNSETGLNNARWVTPDNPLPNPIEGLIGVETVLLKIQGRPTKNWPQKHQWSSVQVTFNLGAMRTVKPSLYKPAKMRSVRDVPNYLRRAVNNFDAYCQVASYLRDDLEEEVPTINLVSQSLDMATWQVDSADVFNIDSAVPDEVEVEDEATRTRTVLVDNIVAKKKYPDKGQEAAKVITATESQVTTAPGEFNVLSYLQPRDEMDISDRSPILPASTAPVSILDDEPPPLEDIAEQPTQEAPVTPSSDILPSDDEFPYSYSHDGVSTRIMLPGSLRTASPAELTDAAAAEYLRLNPPKTDKASKKSSHSKRK